MKEILLLIIFPSHREIKIYYPVSTDLMNFDDCPGCVRCVRYSKHILRRFLRACQGRFLDMLLSWTISNGPQHIADFSRRLSRLKVGRYNNVSHDRSIKRSLCCSGLIWKNNFHKNMIKPFSLWGVCGMETSATKIKFYKNTPKPASPCGGLGGGGVK